jgi:hypothetical protein
MHNDGEQCPFDNMRNLMSDSFIDAESCHQATTMKHHTTPWVTCQPMMMMSPACTHRVQKRRRRTIAMTLGARSYMLQSAKKGTTETVMLLWHWWWHGRWQWCACGYDGSSSNGSRGGSFGG